MTKTLEQLRGIRGWLILLAIGLIGGPGTIANNVDQARRLYAAPIMQSYITPGSSCFDPAWKALFVIETNIQSIMIIPAIILPCLFFFKHRSFPTIFSTFCYSTMCLTIARIYLVMTIPTISETQKNAFLAPAIMSLLIAAAWIAYILRSQRVKNTFIRRFYYWPLFPFFRCE